MKKMMNLFALFALFVALSATTCTKNEYHRYIHLQNNSNKPIYFLGTFSFPDTTLLSEKYKPVKAYKLMPSEKNIIETKVFAYNPTLQVFIFDATIIEQEPWDSIVKKYKVLKRYQFTKQEIENRDWTVTYP